MQNIQRKLTVVLFSSIVIQLYGQEIYVCHTVKDGSKVSKFEMKIIVTDSLVKFEIPSKPTKSYRKLPSPLGIYYTDGVTKSTVAEVPVDGTIRGMRYNYIVALIYDLDKATNSSVATLPNYYCVLKTVSKK